MKSLKVLIASAAFKDVFSPIEACQMIGHVLKKLQNNNLRFNIKNVPMVDGGEYSSDLLLNSPDVERINVKEIIDPTGKPINTYYLKLNKNTAYVSSSDVIRLPPELEEYKNPLLLTTYGLGQMINHAINSKFKNIIIGLGGTSTVDGGIGMAQALGVKFYDKKDRLMGNEKPLVGSDLCGVSKIIVENDFPDISMTALCDGISRISQMITPINQKIGSYYGGERKEITNILKKSLLSYSRIIKSHLAKSGKIKGSEHQVSLSEKRCYGVAGGIILSLLPLFNLKITLGVEYFADYFGLEEHIRNADLIITGEGKFDNSLSGKAPIGVSRLAKKYNKPLLYLCGTIKPQLKRFFKSCISNNLPDEIKNSGISAMISCHNEFDNLPDLRSYADRIKHYKENTPKLFSKALLRYLKAIEGV